MNPSSNGPGMELPPPAIEPLSQNNGAVEAGVIPMESMPAAQEQASNPSSSAPVMPPAPIAVPPVANPLLFASSSQTDDNVAVTDAKLLQDKDLIEKEWVNKAKAIIDKNREDPYKQSEDITLLKADYMKKQFNKTLKLNK